MNRPSTFWPLGVSILVGLVMLFAVSFCAHAQVQTEKPPVALDAEQETRFRALLPDLRCLVCQNESIAESNAPLALDLRYQVREQLAAGLSDAEIKRYLIDRYGEFVLFRPPFRPGTWLLWLGPLLLVATGGGIAWRMTRRRDAIQTAPMVDDAALRALLDDTAAKDGSR